MAEKEYIERAAVMNALLNEQYGYLCEDAINAIPAADVRPVVRGKWVLWMRIPEDYICDKCEWHNRIKTNFCPNCGADMREES